MSIKCFLEELALYPEGISVKEMKNKPYRMKILIKNKYIRREITKCSYRNGFRYVNFITEEGKNFLKETKWIVI